MEDLNTQDNEAMYQPSNYEVMANLVLLISCKSQVAHIFIHKYFIISKM